MEQVIQSKLIIKDKISLSGFILTTVLAGSLASVRILRSEEGIGQAAEGPARAHVHYPRSALFNAGVSVLWGQEKLMLAPTPHFSQ